LHNLVELKRFPLEALGATESEDLLHQLFGPSTGLVHLLHIEPGTALRRHLAVQQGGKPQERRQDVVELMGNAPASVPRASIFCVCRSCASRRWRALT